MTEQYIKLQHSESVIAQMAATIFAAFINNNSLTNSNEAELIEKSVLLALELANQTEKLVVSDEEMMPRKNL